MNNHSTNIVAAISAEANKVTKINLFASKK